MKILAYVLIYLVIGFLFLTMFERIEDNEAPDNTTFYTSIMFWPLIFIILTFDKIYELTEGLWGKVFNFVGDIWESFFDLLQSARFKLRGYKTK